MSFKLVDMAKSPAEIKEDRVEQAVPGNYPEPLYPYGLCLYFNNEVLEKLNLEANCEVGDLIDLRALAKVTSVSQREVSKGDETVKDSRIELQITMLAVENEDEEAETAPQKKKMGPARLYQRG